MADIDLLLEAERRGILPQDRLDMLQEARKRGIVPAPLSGAASTVEPSGQATAPKQEERIQELSAREPDTSEWLADKTGMSSDYWRRTLWNLKAPARVLQGAEAPAQGLEKGLLSAGEYATSLGGYAPNALSRGLGSASNAMGTTLQRQEERYQTERTNAGVEPGTADYSRMAGTAISPVTVATGQLLAPAAGANILGRLYGAARTGAAIGAEQPVTSGNENYAGNVASQAETGAAIGAGMELGAGVVAPWLRDKAQRLVDQYGIRVPFLSGMGFKTADQISTSVPGSGLVAQYNNNLANKDLVRATANEALAPVGEKVGPATEAGRGMMKEVNAKGEQAYTAAINPLKSNIDPQLTQDIASIRSRLPTRIQGDFDDQVQKHLLDRADQNGNIYGQDVKNADMDLRNKATNLIQKGDSWDHDLGVGLRDVRDAMGDMWTRHNTPEQIAALKAADRTYGLARIMERASSYTGAPEGVFNPSHLESAVKAQDFTLGKREFTEGDARLQDLAETAKAVFGGTVSDSGTPIRSAYMGVPALAVGAATGNPYAVGAAASAVGHGAFYLPPVQNALRSLAGGWPAARTEAANAIRQISPGVSAVMVSKQPYDNSPRSVREWQAIHQQKLNAAKQAIGYYGQQ